MPRHALLELALALLAVLFSSAAASAQQKPSTCVAMAGKTPEIVRAAFTPAGGAAAGTVKLTYAGHSTYVIETPEGVRIATDYSGIYGDDPLPRVVTMNKAHRTHFTPSPDARIEYVLTGWNPEGGPIKHRLSVDDVFIRNVTTDIRSGALMEADGNSIFIFEVAGLCIGHLGHLHHPLEDRHFAEIGRLDVVMVPIDGGMTQSLENMREITDRLHSSIVLPMHRHSTPIAEFTAMMGKDLAVEFRGERWLEVTTATLPRRPTIILLEGV